MIPHIGFWKQYPQLVIDGVEYTKILVGAGGAGSGGFAPMNGSAERDTFSQFRLWGKRDCSKQRQGNNGKCLLRGTDGRLFRKPI